MRRALVTAVTGALFLVLAPAASAHHLVLPKCKASNAPKLCSIKKHRSHIAVFRSDRCITPRKYRFTPAHTMPSGQRRAALINHTGWHREDASRASRCVPTGPVAIIRYVWPDHLEGSAIRVASCETVGFTDFYNEGSGASGLFQIMPLHGDFPPYDHLKNARYALRLYYQSGWWPWLASNSCHGLL